MVTLLLLTSVSLIARATVETVSVSNFTTTPMVSAGFDLSAILHSNGTVWTWGRNANGQLGDGTTVNRNIPVQVQNLNNVTAIGASTEHTVALRYDGTVWAWGGNFSGRLGDGTTTRRLTPVQVLGLNNIIAIAVGNNHTVALCYNGTVWTWGRNLDGQLGDGTTTDRFTPIQVQNLSNIIAITASGSNTVALRSDGTVWAWGGNFRGQLSTNTTVELSPVQVQGLNNITAIASGENRILALHSNGTVWSLGNNSLGQLGNGTWSDNRYVAPIQAQGLSDIANITARNNSTIAFRNDGTVWAWGSFGQHLSGETLVNSMTPMQINSDNNIIDVTLSNDHAIIINDDGYALAWGLNHLGQLGNGRLESQVSPVRVLGGATGDQFFNVFSTNIASPTIPVTGVTIAGTATRNLTTGQTLQLSATVAPANATNRNVTWTSSNTAVVTVNANGLVTARDIGTTTITARTIDGNFTASITITVERNTDTIFGTGWESTPLNWIMFFVLFGWIWMWF